MLTKNVLLLMLFGHLITVPVTAAVQTLDESRMTDFPQSASLNRLPQKNWAPSQPAARFTKLGQFGPDTFLDNERLANEITDTTHVRPLVCAVDHLIAGDVTASSPTKSTATETPTPTPSCVYPDDPKSEAPEWLCNPSMVTGTLLAAVGSSQSFNPMLQRMKCEALARLSLAQTLEVSVEALFQQYAEMTGQGKTLELMVDKTVTQQQVNVTLRGTSVTRTATSPKGTYYCLMVMETGKYEAIAEIAKEEAKNSTGDRRALWQKFQAQMPIEEMAQKLEEQERDK